MAVRIQSELKKVQDAGLWEVELENGEDLFKWNVVFQGPTACDSPYEDGTFLVKILFPADYPWKPPQVFFSTKILHPNISKKGEVCTKSFSEGWVPKNTILSTVIPFIQTLLLEPDSGNPMDPEAAELLTSDPSLFKKKAREWTKKYAC